MPDSARVLLSAKKTNNNNNVNISINKPGYAPVIKQKQATFINTITAELPAAIKPDSVQKRVQQIMDLRNRRMLKEVTVKAHKVYHRKKPDLSTSDNLNGPGNADQVIMDTELKGCVNLADCLVGIITGVEIINGIPHNLRTIGIHGPPVMVLIIDGAINNDIKLEDLNPSIIHSIEVLKSGSYLGIYGGRAGGGALVITTKRAGDKSYLEMAPAPGTLRYIYNGFYKAHEFYSPKYDTPQDKALAADLRGTIFWSPNIITGNDGKTTLNYYNGGTKGTYRVVIEGINDDGNLGRLVYRYKVE
ncbi:TonB-dependent receptor plug domain-containing protein [uncultured Mucilaginibacter sp.]|uniref:TonB-dependent receptor plug domain-containing protein n=1 Tax=uncultured Mucilaginibacter sp. TaxID=797541 RepID=UPI0025EDBBDA|nr:TonB-dependent receptor plug domain-containing protein [uncultured Mucilaginibacter sp.]